MRNKAAAFDGSASDGNSMRSGRTLQDQANIAYALVDIMERLKCNLAEEIDICKAYCW